ncbi:hypothetical protein BTUL_0038g00350 [Botrytis tulipae]|uniref:Uncharacterized protein n=1 Tax=Botrytis tulipae TaxID=87230 RepID=A0A4Z1ETM8_9HELO|nr:hypothetical protein BTUL_0038g00350 [Botrytis tulipae]
MKRNVEKKSADNEDNTGNTTVNKKREISRIVSRSEHFQYDRYLPLDNTNLIADSLPPSSIVLLGLTCHKLHSLFSRRIAETPLKALV